MVTNPGRPSPTVKDPEPTVHTISTPKTGTELDTGPERPRDGDRATGPLETEVLLKGL